MLADVAEDMECCISLCCGEFCPGTARNNSGEVSMREKVLELCILVNTLFSNTLLLFSFEDEFSQSIL